MTEALLNIWEEIVDLLPEYRRLDAEFERAQQLHGNYVDAQNRVTIASKIYDQAAEANLRKGSAESKRDLDEADKELKEAGDICAQIKPYYNALKEHKDKIDRLTARRDKLLNKRGRNADL